MKNDRFHDFLRKIRIFCPNISYFDMKWYSTTSYQSKYRYENKIRPFSPTELYRIKEILQNIFIRVLKK